MGICGSKKNCNSWWKMIRMGVGIPILFSDLQVWSMAPSWESRVDLYRLQLSNLFMINKQVVLEKAFTVLHVAYTLLEWAGSKKEMGTISSTGVEYFLCLWSVGEIQFLQSGVCHSCTGTSCDGSNRGNIKHELYSRQLLSGQIWRTDNNIFLTCRTRLVPNKSSPVKL